MRRRLRAATQADIPAVLSLRARLRIDRPEDCGGFLLGCSEARYRWFADHAIFLLIEEKAAVNGFAIALPDPVVRASALWQRVDRIAWREDAAPPPTDSRLGYFEQLALSPEACRLTATPLAFAAVSALAETGHQHLYATILDRPVRNEAALPLLRAIGARAVGAVEEDYPEVGPVSSELHHVPLDARLAALAASRRGRKLAQMVARLTGRDARAGAPSA